MRPHVAIVVVCLAAVGLHALAHGPAQRNPVFSGVVISVLDGDTFKVRTKGWGDWTVRLWGIDAPELDQPFGQEAKKHLSRVVLNKHVVVEDYTGKNGVEVRVGEAFVESDKPPKQDNVNEVMVAAGFAWWERLPDNSDLRYAMNRLMRAEEAARQAKRGLWSKSGAIPPWDWKKGGKSGR
jgi:micrococcal nuclease